MTRRDMNGPATVVELRWRLVTHLSRPHTDTLTRFEARQVESGEPGGPLQDLGRAGAA